MEEETMNWDKEETLRIMTSAAPENAKCSACTRTSSESGEALYYTYSSSNQMIHKKCAELPKRIDHPMHPEHPLVLLAKPPYRNKTCECQVCQKDWKNFVYHCPSCEFDIDIMCAFLEDENIMIPTHHHPVKLIQRFAIFEYDVCGVQGWDNESYICTKPSCRFWIHKKCGSLPEVFERPDHDHPLLLAISMPVRYLKYKFTCDYCHQDFGSKVWIYYCQRCKYFIHIKCITAMALPVPWSPPGITSGDPPRLAMIRQLKTVNMLQGVHLLEQEGPQLPEVQVESHKHSLVLTSDHHRDEDEFICDGCIEPIDRASPPYYKCGQHCNFFLHTTCATLPKHCAAGEHRHPYNIDSPELKLYFPKNPWEVVKCKACSSFCNGYAYKCPKSGCNFSLDIKCCYLIGYTTHIGHKHHLYPRLYRRVRNGFTCSGCGNFGDWSHLYCDACSFSLGYECAMLPASVKHPLILSFPPHFRDRRRGTVSHWHWVKNLRNGRSDTDADDEFYCEVCEEEIHPKHWIYRCAECDQSFHPRCIPTLGESRNIKFGKTCSIKRHPHRLTIVPQAKLTSLCHTCRKSLYWSRAFECEPCGFYLCPDCIPKEELVEDD